MAIQPRQIAGMVEGSMGAGGQAMPEEQSLQTELPSTEEQLPDGIELMDEGHCRSRFHYGTLCRYKIC